MDLFKIQLSLEEIKISYPHLLKNEMTWRMCLQRDYPEFTFITDCWSINYKLIQDLQELSRQIGDVYIQYETLREIRDQRYDMHNISLVDKVLSLWEVFHHEHMIYFLEKGFKEILPHIKDAEKNLWAPRIYFKNGNISIIKGDSYLWHFMLFELQELRDNLWFWTEWPFPDIRTSHSEFKSLYERYNNPEFINEIIDCEDFNLLISAYQIIFPFNNDIKYKAMMYHRANRYKIKKTTYKLNVEASDVDSFFCKLN